jgi:hypothetical protein
MKPLGHHKGTSLVEMMTVLVVMSLVFGLAGTVLSCLFSLDHIAREDIAFTDTLTALELQLRRDAHESSAVQIVDGVAQCERGGQKIQWTRTNDALLREASQDGEITSRERWSFPTPYEAAWSVQESEGHSWLTLKLSAAAAKDKHFVRTDRGIAIVAEIGRFAQASREKSP